MYLWSPAVNAGEILYYVLNFYFFSMGGGYCKKKIAMGCCIFGEKIAMGGEGEKKCLQTPHVYFFWNSP